MFCSRSYHCWRNLAQIGLTICEILIFVKCEIDLHLQDQLMWRFCCRPEWQRAGESLIEIGRIIAEIQLLYMMTLTNIFIATTDDILALRLLLQIYGEFDEPLHVAYIDIKAAFDSMSQSQWKCRRWSHQLFVSRYKEVVPRILQTGYDSSDRTGSLSKEWPHRPLTKRLILATQFIVYRCCVINVGLSLRHVD